MRVPLTGGAYQVRSLIAGAQRQVNLYSEQNPPESQSTVPVTLYLTPGLRLLGTSPNIEPVRQVYRATNGDLYICVGPQVYYVTPSFQFINLGTIADQKTPVSFSDNGSVVVLVDGTLVGYCIDISQPAVTRQFGVIADPNFLGGNFVDYIDTFFVLNKPDSRELYISLSQVTFADLTNPIPGSAFDALDFAQKTGSADNIQRVIVFFRTVWPLGVLTSEAWINSGAADFTLQPLPGVFIEHGCIAPFSVATQDKSAYWLSQDRQGKAIVVKIQGYDVHPVSPKALDTVFQSFPIVSDAIGFTYQQNGHVFYVITFPSANATYAMDLQTEQWFQWAYTDADGNLNRHRANCACFAYGLNIVGDWQNGNIYALDPDEYTDNGNPISRIRSFPVLVDNGVRVTYSRFIADIQVGTYPGTTTDDPPQVSLRWSDDWGETYGNFVERSMGSAGQYDTSPKWAPCGMARGRVFEISWSTPTNTAFNGAFIEMKEHRT